MPSKPPPKIQPNHAESQGIARLGQPAEPWPGLVILANLPTRPFVLADGWVQRFECDRAEAFRRELEAVPDAASTVQQVKDAGILVCVASQGSLELCGYRQNSSYVARRIMSR